MRVILASSSPRRKELMKMFDIPFEIMVKETDEKLNSSKDCYNQCIDISYEKAKMVFNEIKDDNVIVIGSDTVVIYNNEIYGKPKNYLDAYNMIQQFSGNTHEVVSALSVLIRKDNKIYEEKSFDKCYVSVSLMNDKEINDWINNHDVLTRAGAYAIQDGFAKYIEKIEGDYFSIVGLPVHRLYDILKKYL